MIKPLFLILLSTQCFAQDSGLADVLLKSVSNDNQLENKKTESDDIKTVKDTSLAGVEEFKLTDSFLAKFHSEWIKNPGMKPEVSTWAKYILTGRFEEASHLWGSVTKAVPASFESISNWAQTYLMYRLGLENSFVDQLVQTLKVTQQKDAEIAKAFTDTTEPTLLKWVTDGRFTFSQEFLAALENHVSQGYLSPKLALHIRAWMHINSPNWSTETATKALSDIDLVPSDNPLRIELAKRLVVYYSSQGQLAVAGKVAKAHLEASLESQKGAEKVSGYYLMLGRLLFQADALDAAEKIYRTIPKGSPDYLAAQEELAWVFLRSGKLSELRGWVKSFDSGLFDQGFYPEVQVVGAVSSLKLCYYNDVRLAFDRFQKSLKPWASKFEAETAAGNSSRPVRPTFISQSLEKLEVSLLAEIQKLNELNDRSIAASLPAVGVQSHWGALKTKMTDLKSELSKRKQGEYKKYWLSQSLALKEAIRKMKFVKIEFLNQIATLKAHQEKDSVTSSQAQSLQSQKSNMNVDAKTKDTTFAFDGLIWPDELFKLNSLTEGKCLQ